MTKRGSPPPPSTSGLAKLDIYYIQHGCYGVQELTKKKRALRKRAAKLVIERGQV